jgi:hypothetical protein
MCRLCRIACLVSAAGIAAAPGIASDRQQWRPSSAEVQTAGCQATIAKEPRRGAMRRSASLAPQGSHSAQRDAAAARLARLWAGDIA